MQHVPIMSWATRTHVRVKSAIKCGPLTRQKTRCSVFTPVACTTFDNVCTRDFWKQKSANSPFTISPLVIMPLIISPLMILSLVISCPRHWESWCSCSCCHQFWSTMMKRKKRLKRKTVARNKSSNFDSSILILLAMLHRMVFASFSRSSEFGNSVVLVLIEDLREFSQWVWNLFLHSLVQLDDPHRCTPTWWCSRTGASDARVRCKRCRSSWDSPRIGNILRSIHGLAENFDIFHPLATWLRLCLVMCPCSSSGIHCFPMVLLPLSLAVLLAPWAIHSCKVTRDYQSLESCYCFFIKSKRTEGQPLRQVLQAWMALDGSGSLSQLVQLDVAQFILGRLDSSLTFIEFSGFPNLQEQISCVSHFLICPLLLGLCTLALPRLSCAVPSILRSTLISGSFSSSDSALPSTFLAMGSSGLSVLLLLLLRLPSTLKYNLRCGTKRWESLK